MPEAYEELPQMAQSWRRHYRDMQDIEFTIEDGKLWMLQTRDGKRTAQAAVRIAVDMADEGLISREDAVRRVTPEQVDFFLHPQLSPAARRPGRRAGRRIATGLNVSPGAAVGIVAFDADMAQRLAGEGRAGHPGAAGDQARRRARHARRRGHPHQPRRAHQPRRPGGPPVRQAGRGRGRRTWRSISSVTGPLVGELVIEEGDWVSLDGSTGEVYLGELDTVVPDLADDWLARCCPGPTSIAGWACGPTPTIPRTPSGPGEYGAEGIGLCRTEHMFFEPERLPIVQRMIMSDS